MLKNPTSSLTAQKLRIILIAGIFLLIAVAGVLFFFARNVLATYSVEVQKMTATAESSSENLNALNTLKTKLAEDAESVERAKSLVAESQSYAYQDQIIKDINMFASKAGVGVSGYQFNSESGAAGGGTTAAAPADATAQAAPTVSGLKTVNVSVNLASPVKYESIMHFINMIEQNLTKMQLAGISLAKDEQTNGVTASSLTLEVYVK